MLADDLANALNEFCSVFKFNKLNMHQQKAIELFVNGKRGAITSIDPDNFL